MLKVTSAQFPLIAVTVKYDTKAENCFKHFAYERRSEVYFLFRETI